MENLVRETIREKIKETLLVINEKFGIRKIYSENGLVFVDYEVRGNAKTKKINDIQKDCGLIVLDMVANQ